MLDWIVTYEFPGGGPPKNFGDLTLAELNMVELAIRGDYANIDHAGGKMAALDRIRLERQIRSRTR